MDMRLVEPGSVIDEFHFSMWAGFVEFMLGYYTRGFDKELDVEFKSAHLFFGVGFSLEQLFFRPLDKAYGWPFGFMGLAANYFQVPYTYASVESVRTAPSAFSFSISVFSKPLNVSNRKSFRCENTWLIYFENSPW